MSFVQPFSLGDYLFVELLSTTPPYVIHRTIHVGAREFTGFRTFKNVNPQTPDAAAHSRHLQAEAAVLRSLELPAVPRIRECGEVHGHAYLITDYVWGKSLLHILRELRTHRKMLPPDFAVHIVSEVLRGLQAAHEVHTPTHPDGVTHLNLSPRNIIVSFTGTVHLVDFGHRPPQLSRDTWNQFEFRNLTYLSPEQVTAGAVSARSDQFTAAAILYELVTGTPPFLEKTAEKVVHRIARCSFAAPATVNPSVPRELDRLVLRAMAAYPDDRFASAGELAGALEHWLKKERSDVSRVTLRKLMRSLFQAEIVEEIRHFGRIAGKAPSPARSLVASIPRRLFDEFHSGAAGETPLEGLDLGSVSGPSRPGTRVTSSRLGPGAREPAAPAPAAREPAGPEHDRDPACTGLSTVNVTLEEFARKQPRLPNRDRSFFEAEDTVLAGGPGPVRIVPVRRKPGGKTSVQDFGKGIPDPDGKGKSAPGAIVWDAEPDPPATPAIASPATASPATASPATVAVQDDRALLVGRLLGEYRVTGVLGWGGMGTVYDGLHETIGKEVAIKVLNPHLVANRQIAQRFLAEAKAVNSIRNPNIIDIFSFGVTEEQYHYFVMEKLNGITLGSYLLQHGTVPLRPAYEILTQVFSAIAAAHDKGIIHRDLKPENIYLERRALFDHYVKILDFGIAKFTVNGFKTAVTKAGTPIGTPKYMSPEQCKGVDVTVASDIYALGIIMYEMFTGTIPFRKKSYLEMLLAHLNEPPPRPSLLVPMDPPLENLILWALQKDPGKRPPSVRDLAENVLAYLKEKI